MTTPQMHIRRFLDDRVARGQETGLQAAAYYKGKLIVDAWVGHDAAGKPVDGDTLFVVFSVTKGITATVIHMLVERGLLAYDAPIARYWPEFAQNGKTTITLRQVMAHTSGIPHLPPNMLPEDMLDWAKMRAWIEQAAPLWPPGTQTGYHALTIGWILGEVAQRVDGRPIARIVAEDICAPLKIDSLFFGMPGALADRLAVLEYEPDPALVPPPDALIWQVIPATLQPLNTWANRLEFARAVVPAGNAVANARALARVYAALVGDGVEGVRLLPPERVRAAIQIQTDDVDCVIGQAWPKGLGYFLGSATATTTCISATAFGHTGAGGFTAYADPAYDLAFALCKTRMVDTSDPDEVTARLFERELHRALGL